MKKFLIFIICIFVNLGIFAEDAVSDTTININEVTVTSLYRNNVNVGYLISQEKLIRDNHGQEPSNVFKYMPNIFSTNENGTEYGYGYFRIRGLDQTRINVTLDGMPWNEAEDYGAYFVNSPDLMSSLQSIKVERGTNSSNNGTASSGGSINLESIDLFKDNPSYGYIGIGLYKTYKTSIIYNDRIGKSAFHIKATQQQTDAFRDHSGNNSRAFTIKYGYLFNDRNSIDILSLNGRHYNGQGWLGSTKEEIRLNKHANGCLKEEDDKWFQSINKIQYKGCLTPNLLLTSSVYLQYQDGGYNFDLDNYMNRMVDPSWQKTGVRYCYGLTHYLYGGNAALKYIKDNLTITGGTNFYWFQRRHFMTDRLIDRMNNVDPSEYYDNTGYKRDFNGFLSTTYSLKKFSFEANVQYRYVDFDYVDNMNPLWSFGVGKYDTKWNFINYGLNAEYKLNNLNKFYIRYSEVSREPTRTDMFGGNEDLRIAFIANGMLSELTTNKAERSYDIETGYEVNTNKIKANVNLYYMRFKNERVLNGQVGMNGLPLHDTADKSYRMGIETSLDWNFFDNFHYVLNGSLSKNKINSDTFKDKYHILTPSFTMNNEIYYKGKNYRIAFNNLYHSKMYIDQNNKYKIPEYLVFNLNGSYKFKNIEVGARINNIFNKTNYCKAEQGATELLWFRECGTTIFGDVKIFF